MTQTNSPPPTFMLKNTNDDHPCLLLPNVHFTAASCLPGCSQKSNKPYSQPKECFSFCADPGVLSLSVFGPTTDSTGKALGRLSHTSATDPDFQAISLIEASSPLSQCPSWPICDFQLHGVERQSLFPPLAFQPGHSTSVRLPWLSFHF